MNINRSIDMTDGGHISWAHARRLLAAPAVCCLLRMHAIRLYWP
jgi:hypothetical protein